MPASKQFFQWNYELLWILDSLILYHWLYLGGFVVLGFADFDSQQTVPLLQELVLCKMLEGLLHNEDMDWGKQKPGHLTFSFGFGFDSFTFFVLQHLPFPGHSAFLSISSQSKAKKPLTQVPPSQAAPVLDDCLGLGVDFWR